MLSEQDNQLLCRVGPGTPMGTLMRQYWIPALAANELPEPDGRPLRIRLLGENLIAFRDSEGQVGILANNCPHRGASLFFGRNEESGLRCVYHGWKFDVTGRCVDMPNEPAESNFKEKITAVAYPTQERGGLIWAYMGPRETPPPLPELEVNMLPEGQHVIGMTMRECNWMQALEGDIDTSHAGFLHLGSVQPEDVAAGSFDYYAVHDRAPRYIALDTDAGTSYGAYRPAEPGMVYWRIAHFLFPFWTMIPTGYLGEEVRAAAWVPIDDEHVMSYRLTSARPMRAGGGAPSRTGTAGSQFGSGYLPNTTDWLGRFRFAANAGNDYLLDVEQQRDSSFTGIQGIFLQDQAVTESMGAIFDRSSEHLGTSDLMIIRTRRRLIEAAEALRDQQLTPPGVDRPEVYRLRSGGILVAEGVNALESTQDLQHGRVAQG
jgi:phthalate 4,5-dioxygenase oxygenase subunit